MEPSGIFSQPDHPIVLIRSTELEETSWVMKSPVVTGTSECNQTLFISSQVVLFLPYYHKLGYEFCLAFQKVLGEEGPNMEKVGDTRFSHWNS